MTEFEINAKEYTVTYDLDNRMSKVEVDGNEVEYRYDAMGRRVFREESNSTTALIWWGNSENDEHKHTVTQTVIYNDIFEHPSRLNAVIARAIDGSRFDIQWFHKNYLDHVYAVSDDSGDILEHYRYTAFGEVTIYDESGNIRAESQIDNDILWNTRRLDEVSGLYLYKYRHYSAELGRWLGRDPIEEDGGVNLYAFVGNHPIIYWDKLGQKLCCCAEDIKINPFNGGTGEFDNVVKVGHTFEVELKLRYVKAKKTQNCFYAWSERTNVPAFTNQQKNKWTNMFDPKLGAGAFTPASWTNHKKALGPVTVFDSDTPSLAKTQGRTVKRKLEISITLGSGAPKGVCKCSTVKLSIEQNIELKNGVTVSNTIKYGKAVCTP